MLLPLELNTALLNIRFLQLGRKPGELSRYSDGLGARRHEFDSRYCKLLIFSTYVQIGSGAHTASYPIGGRDSFLAVKAAGA